MIVEGVMSETAQAITVVLADLQKQRGVETAVLCTEDGLAVNGQGPEQIAAVASFLVASAKQTSVILGGHKTLRELTIGMGNNSVLVCWPFTAAETNLIIAVIFKQKVAYKRLLTRMAGAIQQAIEA